MYFELVGHYSITAAIYIYIYDILTRSTLYYIASQSGKSYLDVARNTRAERRYFTETMKYLPRYNRVRFPYPPLALSVPALKPAFNNGMENLIKIFYDVYPYDVCPRCVLGVSRISMGL